jgi:hypothetical protein
VYLAALLKANEQRRECSLKCKPPAKGGAPKSTVAYIAKQLFLLANQMFCVYMQGTYWVSAYLWPAPGSEDTRLS